MATHDIIVNRSEKQVAHTTEVSDSLSDSLGPPVYGRSETVDEDLISDICTLLESFQGEVSLKRLFWELLSYDRIREPLAKTLLPPSALAIVGRFEIFAAVEAMTVAYAETERLPAGWQLEQIAQAARRHLGQCVLALNYNAGWALIYPDDTRTPRIRVLLLPGPADQRLRTAQALLALNAATQSGEVLGRLEQSERLDEFFPGITPNLTDIVEDFDRIANHRDPEVRELLPFLRAISVYPLLTEAQERGRDLWGAQAPTQDQLQIHQQRLILHNLRLVVWMAYKVNRMGITLSDLVQEGCIGLMTAAQRFEFDRGNRFTTYAFHWIRQAMYRALHNQCNIIRWPVHIAPSLIKAAKTREFDGLAEGHKPPVLLGSRLDNATYYETDPFAGLIKEEIVCGVRNTLEELRVNEKIVLQARFGLQGEEQTLEEIGQSMGVTRERVRQIEERALRRLKHPARQVRFVPYNELSEWMEFSQYDEGANGRSRAPLRNYVAIREGF